MGFRFQKRIKIAPGLKLNLSKSGASLSVGGKGATVNLSKRGAVATVGIPGTGISARTNLTPKEQRRRQKVERKYRQERERELEAHRRKQEYEQRKARSLQLIKHHEEAISKVIDCWRDQVEFVSKEDYEERARIRPFESSEREPKMPSEKQIQAGLRKDINQKFLERAPIPKVFFLVGYVISLVISILFTLISSSSFIGWTIATIVFVLLCVGITVGIKAWWLSHDKSLIDRYMAKYLPARREKKKKEHRINVVEYKQRLQKAEQAWHQQELERTERIRQLVDGNQAIVLEELSKAISELDFPFSSGCEVYVSESGDTAFLNLDLPEIEDAIPEFELRVGNDGGTIEKRRKARKRNAEYLELVSGLVVLVMATTFSSAPSIEAVHIGAYTQRGKNQKDTYVVHADTDRRSLPKATDLQNVDPKTLLSGFGAQAKESSTGRLLMLPKPKWLS